jgi:hypothetical protein
MNYYYKCERYNYCPHIREGISCLYILGNFGDSNRKVWTTCTLSNKKVVLENIAQIQYYILKATLWNSK